ncbi:heparinase II/III family protein [Streptomyces xiamenensis]|uniref:heparinase II/III domain-containing protein n=1 Tax=Streptomyces xiamenensis TaxID=408015 RepID=UPI0036CB4E77
MAEATEESDVTAGPLTARLPLLAPGAGPRLTAALRGAPRRIPAPPVTDRAVWDAVDHPTRDALLRRAAAEHTHPAPVLRASDWARTFRDGVRTAYEDQARALRLRTTLFVLAAVLTGESAAATAPQGDTPNLDAAVDGLIALCEATTWCWAPHDGHTAARGEVLADPDQPYLDLGAAEVATLLAWADHALGPHLDQRAPGVRRRLRREVDLRVLTPFTTRRDWPWIGIDRPADNWNPWIHSAVTAAALLLCEEEPERAATLVRLTAEGLDRFLVTVPDDGGIDEGVAYWWHGAGRLLETLDLFAAVGGPGLDARDLPVLRRLARFPHRMHLGGARYVNAGDAAARLPGTLPWQVLHRWGTVLEEPAVRDHAAARGRAEIPAAHPEAGLGSALTALADPHWRAARARQDPGGSSWLTAGEWLPRTQVLLARERPGTTAGLTVAAKAGHNAERHNHLDIGSYWIALDGAPLVIDLGQPTYTADSFGPHRYRAWPLISAWHNLPAPGGEGQLPGPDRAARRVRAELTAEGAEFHADLTAAYRDGLIGGLTRTIRLVRTGPRPHVTVTDRWSPAGGPVLLRHILTGEVTLGGAGEATVRTAGGRALRIGWDPRDAEAALDHRELTDPLLRGSWGDRLTRLTLTVRGTGTATVRFERAH